MAEELLKLSAPAGAGETLSSAAGAETRDLRAGTPISDSISGYEITREIHRGGQGVVYEAVQKGTKRKVAINVIREGPFAGLGVRGANPQRTHATDTPRDQATPGGSSG